jgi:hypothetical protein
LKPKKRKTPLPRTCQNCAKGKRPTNSGGKAATPGAAADAAAGADVAADVGEEADAAPGAAALAGLAAAGAGLLWARAVWPVSKPKLKAGNVRAANCTTERRFGLGGMVITSLAPIG